jgi:hypothetical protein
MRKATRSAGGQIFAVVLAIVGGSAIVLRSLWNLTKSSGNYVLGLHRYTKIAIGVILAGCIILAIGLQIKHQIRNSIHWKYWAQVITGNWSPDQPTKQNPANGDHLSTDEYVYGVFVATLLNWGSIALIFTALWRIYQLERSLKVNIAKAFSVKTATEIASVLAVIDNEETRKKVSAAFAEAQNEWKDHLIRMIGKNQADRFFIEMDKEIT